MFGHCIAHGFGLFSRHQGVHPGRTCGAARWLAVAGQGVATACPGWLRLATTPGHYGRARLAGVGQGVGFGLPWLAAAGHHARP